MKKLIVFVLLIFSQSVYADCTFSGEEYPEGTVINGYVCGADGKWRSESQNESGCDDFIVAT